MDSSEQNLTPFNSSYQLHRELFGHDRGVRCGCNIDDKYIGFLCLENRSVDTGEEFEYLVTGGVDGDVVVYKLGRSGSCDLVSRFVAHVNTVMCICPSLMVNDFLDLSFTELQANDLTIVEHELCIYTSGRDKLIHRFNLAGKKLLTLEGHDDVVCSLHELSDPSKLVSGSWDGTAIVWNVLSGTQEYRLRSEKYKYSVYVNSMPTGEIVTAMQNGDLCVWKGSKLQNYKKIHEDAVRAVSIKEGYLTCSNDCTVKYHSKALTPVFTSGSHEGFVYDVRHSKLFEVAFSASEDKTARVWNLKNGELLQTIAVESSVWQVVETKYNGIATIELSGKVTLWKLNPGKVENHSQPKLSQPKVLEPSVTKEMFLDMTLFKKFNAEKAKELMLKYNEENKTLSENDLLYFNEFFKKDLSGLRDSYDLSWVLKLLEWPVSQRLPVFDLIKASSNYPFTEKLFKSRNSGSKVIFSANEALKGTDNPQLHSVSLQMFANLLFPSVSRSVMFRQSEPIFESVSAVSAKTSKLSQQSLSVFVQNFAIVAVHNKETKVVEPVVQLIFSSLNACGEALEQEDNGWVGAVMLKHFKTLELLMTNFTLETMENCFKFDMRTLLEQVTNKAKEKGVLEPTSQSSLNFVMERLKT